MAAVPTFHHARVAAEDLVAAKDGRRISLCLPARDEAATVGQIVERVQATLVEEVALVDEVLVLDDHSTDATAEVAAAAGARVVAAGDVHPELGATPGKGQALWKTVLVSTGDLIVWCDADIRDFDPAFVVGLVGPLLTEPDVRFTKGCYHRPGPDGQPGGGRVTELLARPALALLHPALASLAQPLSGEYAADRALLESLPFVEGYGVDIGLLIDAFTAVGGQGLAQVDLGTRRHRNRGLAELSVQATEVLHTILDRAGVTGLPTTVVLDRPAVGPARAQVGELPPPASVDGYQRRSA